ncbi:MAG: hypothetical protein U0T83_07270 [Bacteriovoracaceae bacterium]
MKLLCILLLMSINISLFAKNSGCDLEKIARDVKLANAKTVELDTNTKKIFYQSIEHLSPFKQNLLKKIWEPELKEAKNFIISKDYLDGVKLSPNYSEYNKYYSVLPPTKVGQTVNFLAYGVTMPARVISSIANLKGSKNFLVLGSKVLLTEFIQYPVRNMLYAVSFGAMGEVLDSFKIFTGDPLVEETDPSDLKSDEVIALIKLDKGLMSGNRASATDEQLITELTEKYPSKYFVVDLSSDKVRTYNREYRENKLTFLKGKKIKKVIVSSHGTPGFVYIDNKEYSLSQFGDILNNIHLTKFFDKNVEIHFNSCLLALNEVGKDQVKAFGDKTIPKSGIVKVNTYYGLAGYSLKNTTQNIYGPIVQGLKNSYTYILPIGKAIQGAIYTIDQRSIGKKYNSSHLLPSSFTYTKP